jgi:hypothetical protein
VCILFFFRAPTGNINYCIGQLEATLIYVKHTKAQLITFGDTNINYFIDNHKKDQLQMLLKTLNLKQVTDFPTGIGSSSFLLIEGLFLDKSRIGSFYLFPAMNGGLSDFSGRVLILENFQVSTQNYVHKYELRQTNEYTIQNFQLALENENWEEIETD